MKQDFEIIDSHVHYWQAASAARPWDPHALSPAPVPLSAEQVLALTGAAGVDRVVQVVPSLMGYDNRYALEAAQAYPERIAGVFARVDPLAADVRQVLATLAATPKFSGIRLALLTPLQLSWFHDATLAPVFEAAERYGFPIAIYAKGYAKKIAALARLYPGVKLLVDHMATNHLDAQPFANWSDMLALRSLANIWIKVSHLPELCHAEGFPYPRGQQYFQELLEVFGADRLIWGTNYPPSSKACSYQQSVDFALLATRGLQRDERAKIFSGNLLRAITLR